VSRKFHNQKYDLEFRITYKISSSNIISDVKIGSITLNNSTEPNAKKEEEVVISIPTKEDKQKKNDNPILDQIEKNMVYVEGGSFMMGSKDGEKNEKPVRKVTVSSFKISKYEVTQAEWKAIMGNNPSYNKGCDNCPVEYVNWNDTQDFLKKLNTLTGKNYRLLTEAEWEYAARGGNKSKGYKYAGSNFAEDVAWYNYNSRDKTHPVGQKQPNELGLYDMSGNVYEWCQDWYDMKNKKLKKSPYYRVVRGGAWDNDTNRLRISFRAGNYHPFFSYGFRIGVSE
jgi:formylglycine-generating enzyme required for sulfatase activity